MNESSSNRRLYRDGYTLGHGATAAVLGKVGTWILEKFGNTWEKEGRSMRCRDERLLADAATPGGDICEGTEIRVTNISERVRVVDVWLLLERVIFLSSVILQLRTRMEE
jgi:hypothetical protein